jgi:Effector Associated Constant Component 1
MPITISLSAPDLNDDDLQNLTRQLCRDLNDEAGVTAAPGTRPAQPGAKGDLPVYGQIIIAAIGGGGVVVALVNVLKAYVQRKPYLQFELQKKNGDKVKIKGDDLRASDMNNLTQAIKKAIEEME